MKKGKQPSLNNLLEDTSFINWAKESNQNDVAFWNKWIEQNPDHVDIIYDAKAMVLGISFNNTSLDKSKVDNALASVLKKIDNKATTKQPKKLFNLNKTMLRYAAVMVLLITSAVMIYQLSDKATTVVHKTAYGEIMDLTLPDGTNVVLNGNSEIQYEKLNPRSVTLAGEAYFKVRKKLETNAKFWVHTEDLVVEVYGTEFNVNSREEKTDVLLDEGSVKLLLENGDRKQMVPGDFVSFSRNNKTLSQEKVTSELTYASWKNGTYIFNKVPLAEVLKYIGNTYGLETNYQNEELKDIIISGGIPNQNLNICLEAIQKSTGIKIKHIENELLIINNTINQN
ncbi:FecR family protein [Spongiivirga citrea]|uniref:DUF4974 domain-containing protein n=1 Tax=Spongiivirga citrea TaxID=1481457 RepID=A0A6M0CL56_9FLAO|nr:FecR family protein [Spongiivirga citrea]NER16734.1 DUF4974 domain-containing protein [Spongiivirga citrea]